MYSFDTILGALNSSHLDSLFNMSSLCHMFGYPTIAMGYMFRYLQLKPLDMIGHAFFWSLTNTDSICTNLAIKMYTDMINTSNSAIARHKLITLQGITHSNMLDICNNHAYAALLYDDMASQFETKLVTHLEYKAPWIMLDDFKELLSNGSADCDTDICDSNKNNSILKDHLVLLDLGSGSGLIGKLFHPVIKHSGQTDTIIINSSTVSCGESCNKTNIEDYIQHILELKHDNSVDCRSIIGVDISNEMVKLCETCECLLPTTTAIEDITIKSNVDTVIKSNESKCICKKCYDAVYCLDVKETLRVIDRVQSSFTRNSACININTGAIDIVIAADTFIYVGLLGEIFHLVNKLFQYGTTSSKSGYFSFTIENLNLSANKMVESSTLETGEHATEGIIPIPYEPIDVNKPLTNYLQLLRSSARFAHSEEYIQLLCIQYHFNIIIQKSIVLRNETGCPIYGSIYILKYTA